MEKSQLRAGNFYEGQWHMDMRHGHGKESRDKWAYEGQFHKDLYHGNGKYTSWTKDTRGHVVESTAYDGEYNTTRGIVTENTLQKIWEPS